MDRDPEPVDSRDPFVGRRIGNYVLRKKLGEGGMGLVYLGEHPEIGTKVAVKLLRRELTQRTDIVQRFRREARAVNAIAHENIVRINDFGQTETGDIYLVMELLQGEALADMLQKGPLGLKRTVRLFRQVSRALAAAHACDIIHRDLKPDNIFIVRRPGEETEQARILDFGIAKVLGSDTAIGGEKARLTATGAIVGTPQFMSPEQIDGLTVDHRSDIYALGAILYEAFAGKPVFKGTSFGRLLKAHLDETPQPPSERAPEAGLPASVDALVLACLEKSPESRPQDMGGVMRLLEDVAEAAGLARIPDSEIEGALRHTPQELPPMEESDSYPSLQRPPTSPAVGHGNTLGAWPPPTAGLDDTAAPAGRPPSAEALAKEARTPSPGPIARTMDEVPPARSRTWLLLSAMVIALAGGAAGAFFALSPASPASTSATESKGVEDREDEPGPIQLVLSTEPPGAEVWIGEDRLKGCRRTPCSVEHPYEDAEVTLTFRLTEHEDAVHTLRATANATVALTLTPTAPDETAAPGTAAPETAAPKPGKPKGKGGKGKGKGGKDPGLDGYVDPFGGK